MFIKKFIKERAFLFHNIHQLPNLELMGKSRTNVFLLRHKTKNLLDLLKTQNIDVANFNHMNGLEGKGFVRITIHQHADNQKLLTALQNINRL